MSLTNSHELSQFKPLLCGVPCWMKPVGVTESRPIFDKRTSLYWKAGFEVSCILADRIRDPICIARRTTDENLAEGPAVAQPDDARTQASYALIHSYDELTMNSQGSHA